MYPVETIENLPYRFLLYPGESGAFIGFRLDSRSPVMFCSCQKHAIENRLRLWHATSHSTARSCIRDSGDFPSAFCEQVADNAELDLASKQFLFSDGLCHRCNLRVPSFLGSYPKTGSLFSWTFRHYLRVAEFELGVDSRRWGILSNAAESVRELVPVDSALYCCEERRCAGEINDRSHEWARFSGAISHLVEKHVKTSFGFPVKGAPLISETILYLLIKGALPQFHVERHFRHPKLGGLHFDIYVAELDLAIEYQGDQHYSSFEHLGGTDQFYQTLHRDRKKDELCEQVGITLIHIHGEVYLLSEVGIRALIKRALANRRRKLPTGVEHSVPLQRREQVSEWRAICEEIDTAHRKLKTAKQIAFRNSGRKGFSEKNIMTVYYRWRNAGRTWESLNPYHTLYKRKESLTEALGLSPDSVKQWLKMRGTTTKAWAISHNFKTSDVSQAINAKRAGALSERILLALANDMKSDSPKIRSEVEQMKHLASTLHTRITELEKLLRLPPDMPS